MTSSNPGSERTTRRAEEPTLKYALTFRSDHKKLARAEKRPPRIAGLKLADDSERDCIIRASPRVHEFVGHPGVFSMTWEAMTAAPRSATASRKSRVRST